MPDMREEFETWATKHRMPIHRDGVVTDYSARCTDECWQAWKASRAALRVELPDQRIGALSVDGQPRYVDGWNDYRERVKEALQQAGIEVSHG
ncbi:hypothetical protein I5M10_12595 [Pseudomonas aeruginosa]|nr:hypothetical protein [Pseudomonas aeruginosa]